MPRFTTSLLLSAMLCSAASAQKARAVPYFGPILAENSKYPSRSLGQYLEVCDPRRDANETRRRQNDLYCEGYATALLEAATFYRAACLPATGVDVSVVLAVGNVRSSKDTRLLHEQAFTQLMQALSENYPCPR